MVLTLVKALNNPISPFGNSRRAKPKQRRNKENTMRLPSSVTNQFENICQPRPACRCIHRFQSPKKHSFALICIVRFCRYQPLSSNGLRLFYAVEPLDHESGAVGHIYNPKNQTTKHSMVCIYSL